MVTMTQIRNNERTDSPGKPFCRTRETATNKIEDGRKGSGIGRGACLRLASLGVSVVIADINLSTAQETAKLCKGGKTLAVACDVTNYKQQRQCMETAVTTFGSLDYVFNNAGIAQEEKFTTIDGDAWKKIIDINVTGVLNGCHAAIQIMKKHNIAGIIVNTASMGGIWTMPTAACYAASKAGVVHFTTSLSRTLMMEDSPIRVHALCPEMTDTPLMVIGQTKEEIKSIFGGYLTVEQIIDGFIELLSDRERRGAVLCITYTKGKFFMKRAKFWFGTTEVGTLNDLNRNVLRCSQISNLRQPQSMKAATAFLIFLFSSVLAATNCHTVNPDCDGYGVCMDTGKCRCYQGFFSNNASTPYDCLARAIDSSDARGLFDAVLIIGTVLYCVTFPFVIWRLIIEFRTHSSRADRSVITKVTKISLTSLSIVSLMSVLTCFDFFGMYYRLPPKVFFTLFYARDWILPVCFSAILSHWVELYQYSLKSLRQQEMIRKINVNYSGAISMEDILKRIAFLQRFRIPFGIGSLITIGLWILWIVGTYHFTNTNSIKSLQIAYNAIQVAIWCLFFLGFVLCGIRLLRILPPTVAPKIRKMTYQLCFIVSMCMLDKVVSILNFQYIAGRDGYLTGWRRMINVWMIWLAIIAMLELYMPIRQYKKWLRLSALWHNSSSTSGTGSGGTKATKSGTAQISMEVVEQPKEASGAV
ncbi:ARP protein [Planoprotostelium fungivorum]|uniref:ARP protein n=1 Tax=Planoprotostelium fungivorum TaxID=1890364 RepID=A0A2P6NI04_9EUKA|nr:ARP protein [Planoprotostelium fungivorum]